MKKPMPKWRLYSINGEGRYTADEVRAIIGNPKLNVTAAIKVKSHGIKVVARRMLRFVENGEVIATGKTYAELAENAGYAEQTIQSHATNESKYLRHPYRIEAYWEEV